MEIKQTAGRDALNDFDRLRACEQGTLHTRTEWGEPVTDEEYNKL